MGSSNEELASTLPITVSDLERKYLHTKVKLKVA